MARRFGMAEWAGIGAILLWCVFALVARFIDGVPPLQLVAMCFAIATLAGVGMLAATRSLDALRQPPIAWLHGVGGLFGYHAFFLAALALAPPMQATVINYACPLVTVVLSARVIGLRLRLSHLLGLLTGFIGCALLLRQGIAVRWAFLPGYLCGVLGVLIWSGYSAISIRMQQVRTGAIIGFYAGVAFLSTIAHFLFETTARPDIATLGWITVLGLGPVGLAFLLWDYGMKHGDAKLIGTLEYGAPVGSYLLLCCGGYARFGLDTAGAAILVAFGGYVAARD